VEARLGGGQCCAVVFSEIQLLVVGRRHVAEYFVQPLSVVEADPAQDLALGVAEGGKWRPSTSSDLKLATQASANRLS
jgi:hypothetical protein